MSNPRGRRSFLASIVAAVGGVVASSPATAAEGRQVEIDRADYPEESVTEVRITGSVEDVFEGILDIFDEGYEYLDRVEQRGDISGVNMAAWKHTYVDLHSPVFDRGGWYDWARPWSVDTGSMAGFHDDVSGKVGQYLRENVEETGDLLIQSVHATRGELVVKGILHEHMASGRYE